MSSRALRRLQREQEEKEKLGHKPESEDSEEDTVPSPVQAKKNAFSFLDAADDGDQSDQSDEATKDQQPAEEQQEAEDAPASDSLSKSNANARQGARKKTKKKKKAAKAKEAPQAQPPASKEDTKLDEIDAALKEFKVKIASRASYQEEAGPDRELKGLFELLAVDSRHLNAFNEMKKLFGSTVTSSEAADHAARRAGRGPQTLDLGAALSGRYNRFFKGECLSGLAVRRNVLVLGKEEWPKATSAGLGMELVERAWDFTVEYKFVHSTIYQKIQKEFRQSVQTMDPQALILLLQPYPYHISTLLQVSEIAKQQGDHAVSADLLERALFTFGRSVHSSFGSALSQGKARLDYRRFENREFWLAAWRYINSLGQRGTWRTAFEWAKLLLSLDPEDDPLCIHLILDQLAIRGGEFESLIQLAGNQSVNWGQSSPNVQISLALAHYKAKHPKEAREILNAAVRNYPWVFARMLKELNIDHIPPSIWGSTARTPHEELLCEAYVLRAKDMWNVPEALSLLVEVVETTDKAPSPPPKDTAEISLNETRHFVLSEIRPLLSYLPRAHTQFMGSTTDPLPPPDDLFGTMEGATGIEDDEDEEAELSGPSWLGRMWSRFSLGQATPAADNAAPAAAASTEPTAAAAAEPNEREEGGSEREQLEELGRRGMNIGPALAQELFALSREQMDVMSLTQAGKAFESTARNIQTHLH